MAERASLNAEAARLSIKNPQTFARVERERNRRRLPLASVPAAAREAFRCERWACSLSRWTCSLSRWTCGLRWLEANREGADAGLFRCANCPTGQQHADLVRRQTPQ